MFHRALGGMENIDPRMDQLRTSKFRLRWLPLLLCPRISRTYRQDVQYYSRVVRAICRAAKEVSGCRVLIDSSKFNQDCIVLNRIQDIDLHVVHLVRDSRAVEQVVAEKETTAPVLLNDRFMPQFGIKASAANGCSPTPRARPCVLASSNTREFTTRTWWPTLGQQ